VPLLERLSSYFEDGQLVALNMSTKEVVGAALTIIVDWPADTPKYLDLIRSALSYPEAALKKNPVVYAADLMVLPDFRRKGIGRRLIESRTQVVRTSGLSVTRGSARWSRTKSDENKLTKGYLRCIALGLEIDPVLSFVVECGGELVAPLNNHFDPGEDGCPDAVLTQFAASNETQDQRETGATLEARSG
jgi:GNAT superfamily N-acetyltransferase